MSDPRHVNITVEPGTHVHVTESSPRSSSGPIDFIVDAACGMINKAGEALGSIGSGSNNHDDDDDSPSGASWD